ASRVKAILDGCKFGFIADLAAEDVAEYLATLRQDPPRPALEPGKELFTKAELVKLVGINPGSLSSILRREELAAEGDGKARRYPRATVEALLDQLNRGLGPRTSNSYLVSAKGFTRWLAKHNRAAADALAPLMKVNDQADVRRCRRVLPVADLQRLL